MNPDILNCATCSAVSVSRLQSCRVYEVKADIIAGIVFYTETFQNISCRIISKTKELITRHKLKFYNPDIFAT